MGRCLAGSSNALGQPERDGRLGRLFQLLSLSIPILSGYLISPAWEATSLDFFWLQFSFPLASASGAPVPAVPGLAPPGWLGFAPDEMFTVMLLRSPSSQNHRIMEW